MNAPVELTLYECGHRELKVKDAKHHLCVRCDSQALYLSGILDEELRLVEWNKDVTLHRAECQCKRCAANRAFERSEGRLR